MVILNVGYCSLVTGNRIIFSRDFNKSNRFCVLQFTGKHIVYSLPSFFFFFFIFVRLSLNKLEEYGCLLKRVKVEILFL